MGDETIHTPAAEDEFSAAAPPHPGAQGGGETSFGDAEAPPASELAAVQDDLSQLTKQRDDYLALAQRAQADFENYRKRMARENAAAVDRGMAKLAKELLPALDHLELALKAAEGHEDVVKGFHMVAGGRRLRVGEGRLTRAGGLGVGRSGRGELLLLRGVRRDVRLGHR